MDGEKSKNDEAEIATPGRLSELLSFWVNPREVDRIRTLDSHTNLRSCLEIISHQIWGWKRNISEEEGIIFRKQAIREAIEQFGLEEVRKCWKLRQDHQEILSSELYAIDRESRCRAQAWTRSDVDDAYSLRNITYDVDMLTRLLERVFVAEWEEIIGSG
jgi:hypothetical protein